MTDEGIKTRFALSKLIYAFSAIELISQLSSRFLPPFLEGGEKFDEAIARLAYFGYPGEALITLVVLSSVILAYGHPKAIFEWYPRQHSKWVSVTFGLATGATVSSFSVLIGHPHASLERGLLSWALLSSQGQAFGIFSLLLVAVALPLVGEVFFRGVVLRTLMEYTTVPAAILGSSLLFAFFFVPLYNPLTRLVFGVLSGGLFYRTRSLLGSILASVTLSISLLISVLYRMLR